MNSIPKSIFENISLNNYFNTKIIKIKKNNKVMRTHCFLIEKNLKILIMF